MKKSFNILLLVLVVSLSTMTTASETKVQGRFYANWNLDMTDGAESANSFNLGRAYVTVKSKLSDYTSVRITTDIRNVDNFDGYSIILKYGYIDWNPRFGQSNLKFRFGLQSTLYIDNMNKLWGRRYLEKTIGDKNKFLTTSDLGFSTSVNLGEKGKLGYLALQILNGTSYTDVEELNKNKDLGGFFLLKPFVDNENLKRSRIQGQAYLGTQNVVIDTTDAGTLAEASAYKNQIISFGGMLGYSNIFDFGADLNFQTKGAGYTPAGVEMSEVKTSGMSFFGTLYLEGLSQEGSFGQTLNLFGRYDMLDPNTDVDNDGKSLLIIGLECNPTKGFKASVNFRNSSYELSGKHSESYLYLNTLFKF